VTTLVLVEHDRGALAPATFEALAFARRLDTDVRALAIGAGAAPAAGQLGYHGASVVLVAEHELLGDYGPETWGHTLAAAATVLDPAVVLACGTDVGNEVLAHAAALLDVPFAANCTAVGDLVEGARAVTRLRWGGSLLEDAALAGVPALVSVARNVVDAAPCPVEAIVEAFAPELDPALARSVVVDRVERAAGVTLATAPVVVGGGRGVGSAEGFAALEELAAELGGVVGCSRAVTNNGWRNHTDQVGQTGTRIAPELYIACGISGAIQHWVGAMASKHILAVNTDPDANMVAKADYAVIGDLHAVVPAITAELRRRATP
jgi:electron transfer flavoprotein alpha subunit